MSEEKTQNVLQRALDALGATEEMILKPEMLMSTLLRKMLLESVQKARADLQALAPRLVENKP